MENISWDDLFMTMVYLVAMKSKDESTHIGAVIVGPDKEVRSVGYNSFPRGINDDVPERQQRPEKYYWFAHAERNAIDNAAMVGIPIKGCTMYTNGMPCTDCAFSIIGAGIKEIVLDYKWGNTDKDKWEEHANRTAVMFRETGVEVRYWENDLVEVHKYQRENKFS